MGYMGHKRNDWICGKSDLAFQQTYIKSPGNIFGNACNGVIHFNVGLQISKTFIIDIMGTRQFGT